MNRAREKLKCFLRFLLETKKEEQLLGKRQ